MNALTKDEIAELKDEFISKRLQTLCDMAEAWRALGESLPVGWLELPSLKFIINGKIAKLPTSVTPERLPLYATTQDAAAQDEVSECGPAPVTAQSPAVAAPDAMAGCDDPELAAILDNYYSAPSRSLLEDDVEWVVNDIAELGVKIGNQFFWLYKGHSLVYGKREDGKKDGVCLHDNGAPMHWRHVFKCEFGECAHPINHADYSKIGTVSLSDSPDWKQLPAPTTHDISPSKPLAEGWAIAGPDGKIILHTAGKPTEDSAWSWLKDISGPYSKKYFTMNGYRAVRVRIEEVEG